MKRFFKIIRNVRGTSLMETLIALSITGIVTASIMKLYITQHQNYMTQEDITTIQQNARASIDELTRQIRMAGRDIPAGIKAIYAYDTNPDTLMISFRSGNCDTYLSDPMPTPSAELKCGSAIDCFTDGQWIYIYDPDSAAGEWFEITEVQSAAMHIQHNTMTLSRKYGANAILLAVEQIKFFIDNTTDPDHPSLMIQPVGMDPQVYAEDITDLQFRYHLTNGNVVDEPILIEDILEVIIELTARSRTADVERPKDPFRERTYTSSVNLRNLGT